MELSKHTVDHVVEFAANFDAAKLLLKRFEEVCVAYDKLEASKLRTCLANVIQSPKENRSQLFECTKTKSTIAEVDSTPDKQESSHDASINLSLWQSTVMRAASKNPPLFFLNSRFHCLQTPKVT